MKLVIGLGNIGVKYQNNRHNVGHMVINELQSSPRVKGLIFKKTDRLMNDSGSFVLKNLKAYNIKPEDLYIIHDDLDIPLGAFKIQFGKGPKGHNGILDIEDKIGTSEFWHVRVGVDPTSRGALRGEDIVLSDFTPDEENVLEGVIKQICNQLVQL